MRALTFLIISLKGLNRWRHTGGGGDLCRGHASYCCHLILRAIWLFQGLLTKTMRAKEMCTWTSCIYFQLQGCRENVKCIWIKKKMVFFSWQLQLKDELLRTCARLTPKSVSMLLYTATGTIKNYLCKLKIKKKCSGEKKSLHRPIHFLLWLQAFHQSSAAFIWLLGLESCASFNFRSPPQPQPSLRKRQKGGGEKWAAQTPLQAPAVKKTGAGDLRIWRVA